MGANAKAGAAVADVGRICDVPGVVEDGRVVPWWRPIEGDRASRLDVVATLAARWRLELELLLAGAILSDPPIGMARADAAGVTAALFRQRADARLMYLAARFCADHDLAADKTLVLAHAAHALRRHGWWREDAGWWERGLCWSIPSLVSLACGDDRPGDVDVYARQLRDLHRRFDLAERGVRRAYRLLDEWGRSEGYEAVWRPRRAANPGTSWWRDSVTRAVADDVVIQGRR